MPKYDPAFWCWHCERTIKITEESMANTEYGQTCGRCLRELSERNAPPIGGRGYEGSGDCTACTKTNLPLYSHEGFPGPVCAHCCLYQPRVLTHCAPCQTCHRRIDETDGAMRHPDGLECLHCASSALKTANGDRFFNADLEHQAATATAPAPQLTLF